jgi:hypothetical protein
MAKVLREVFFAEDCPSEPHQGAIGKFGRRYRDFIWPGTRGADGSNRVGYLGSAWE